MSLNTVFNNIRSREKPNDVFITPRELAKLHIDMLDSWYHSPALDPCRNDDSYYNQFPESDSQLSESVRRDYCEILGGKDFLEYRDVHA